MSKITRWRWPALALVAAWWLASCNANPPPLPTLAVVITAPPGATPTDDGPPPATAPLATVTATLAPPPTAPPPTLPPAITPSAGVVTTEVLEAFPSAVLGNQRRIVVYLPPGYAQSEARYKVVYINDGQDMDAMQLQPTLDRLYAEQRLEPLVVVAIAAAADRLQEYGVAGAPSEGYGTRADLYTRFVLEEVMPAINQRYRTFTGAPNTAVMGMSLGGLMAFDLAWRHSGEFGVVGVFSGSFWWRAEGEGTADRRIVHQQVRGSEGTPSLRMWLQAGTADETSDRDGNGQIDSVQDTRELVDALIAKGYRAGEDVVYVEVPDGRHAPATWAAVLPDFLVFAFPAP